MRLPLRRDTVRLDLVQNRVEGVLFVNIRARNRRAKGR